MNKYLKPLNEARKTAKQRREPLFEYCELHAQFDVLPGQFHWAATHADTPMPAARLVNGGRKWYAMSEVRLWWEAIGGRGFACSKHTERNRVYQQRYKAARAAKSLLTVHDTIAA